VPNIPTFSATTAFAGGINSAILRYVGARNVEPTSNATAGTRLDENTLVVCNTACRGNRELFTQPDYPQPLVNPAAPGAPDPNAADVVKINLALGFNFSVSPTVIAPAHGSHDIAPRPASLRSTMHPGLPSVRLFPCCSKSYREHRQRKSFFPRAACIHCHLTRSYNCPCRPLELLVSASL
jgi:hypothetical protein